jgi:uncharacterized MAPEG superfamily protein
MPVLLWCLFIAIFLPYIWSIAAVFERVKLPEGLDNNHPRLQQSRLTGRGARAVAAQGNAWEALIVFAPAVFVAQSRGADAKWAAILGCIWVVARLLHGVFYLSDIAPARSTTFAVSYFCAIGLFVLGAMAS